jgi:carboxyl-terminal processing protease
LRPDDKPSLETEARQDLSRPGASPKPNYLATAVLVIISFTVGLNARSYFPQFFATSKADFSSLEEVKSKLKEKFDGQVTDQQLLDGAKAGIAAAAGDPYTVYLDANATKALKDDLSGTLSGIGAEVGIRSSQLIIISPIVDSPAAKAGLRAKDQIGKINDEDTTGMSLDQAVSKIRGPEGTTVKLLIGRDGGQPFEVTITRAVISVESVKSSMKAGNVGYIQVTRFGEDTSAKVIQAASDLTAQGAKKFILDLRNDPGGYLETAVEVAGVWLDRKVVVEERRGDKVTKSHTSVGRGSLVGVKTIVLINSGSASASEIVAGALQDHQAATLLGEKSYGKGSVQELVTLSDGANLKVTVAHWYTPKGKNINKEGITPDTEIKMTPADLDASRDPQLDKALELLK